MAIASITAAGQAILVSVNNKTGAQFQFRGTFRATIIFEGCGDTAAVPQVWTEISAISLDSGNLIRNITGPCIVAVPAVAFQSIRARCLSYVSGTVTVESYSFNNATASY